MTSNPSGSSTGALSSVLPRSEEWPLNVRSSAPPRRRSRPVVLAAASGRGLLSSLRADPRQAVQEDSIRCLVCGGSFRQLTNTHLRVHRLNAEEYKQRFGYNRGRPLMCAELCRLYTDRAVKTGLASRIRERPILVRPELRRRGGTRTIALEELLTRRDVRRRVRETHTTV